MDLERCHIRANRLCLFQEAFNAASEQVSQYEAEIHEIGSVDDLVADKTRIQDKMKAKKDLLKNLNVSVM